MENVKYEGKLLAFKHRESGENIWGIVNVKNVWDDLYVIGPGFSFKHDIRNDKVDFYFENEYQVPIGSLFGEVSKEEACTLILAYYNKAKDKIEFRDYGKV